VNHRLGASLIRDELFKAHFSAFCAACSGAVGTEISSGLLEDARDMAGKLGKKFERQARIVSSFSGSSGGRTYRTMGSVPDSSIKSRSEASGAF